jgi:hypothetical protein
VSDADIKCDVTRDAVTANGRLADREAAEMLKKKKPKRDSNLQLRIEICSPTAELATADDADTVSEAMSDNNKFLETSL